MQNDVSRFSMAEGEYDAAEFRFLQGWRADVIGQPHQRRVNSLMHV